MDDAARTLSRGRQDGKLGGIIRVILSFAAMAALALAAQWSESL